MPDKPVLSKAAFRGTLVFLVVMTVIFVLPDILAHFSDEPPVHISFANNIEKRTYKKLERNSVRRTEFKKKSRYRVPPALFDPNKYTQEEWMALGLSEKQAAVVTRFSKRGLRSNEDLKKIFVIPDELYILIKDSTQYPAMAASMQKSFPEAKAVSRRSVELNAATEEELLSVKGIGPFFAKQIIKQRERLGGYYSPDQLLEVWKMDEEKLGVMRPYLVIDPALVKKININTVTLDELKIHPYIGYNVANSIIKMREQYGSYKTIEGIRKSVLVTEELYTKLRPYLQL